MRDNQLGFITVIAPAGAGPNDPATIINEDPVRADLAAYYQGFGETVITGTILQLTATRYVYDVLITGAGTAWRAIGERDTGTQPYEFERIGLADAAPFSIFGRRQPASVEFQGTWVLGSFFSGFSELRIDDSGSNLTINPGAGFTIDGNNAPRGFVGFSSLAADTTPSAVENTVMNMNKTWVNGRCYRHILRYQLVAGAGTTSNLTRIRKGTIAGGAYVNNIFDPVTNALNPMEDHVFYMRNTSGADITENLAMTLTPTGGNLQISSGANRTASWHVEDCGLATDFPNVNTHT